MFLIYVNKIGKNSKNLYEYEFYFSDTLDFKHNEEWFEDIPLYIDREDMLPICTGHSIRIMRVITDVPFFCAQDSVCYPFEFCVDKIVSIAFENISEYEEYPEPYRIVFNYGEDYESVREKLNGRNIDFETNE